MTELEELPYKITPTKLNPPQERFVQLYVATGNLRQSFEEAFGLGVSANPAMSGRQLLRNPTVLARVHEHQRAFSLVSAKSIDALTRELEELVEADVSELIHIRTGACRHCWGVGFGYQWRDAEEFEAAVGIAIEKRLKALPSGSGGFGYLFRRGPNPQCPQCEGEGLQRVVLADTGEVSPGARRLYKGVECYPDGSIKKVLLHDQMVARQELHRIRGMHVERSLNLSLSATVPDAKNIASNPEEAMSFLEGLKS